MAIENGTIQIVVSTATVIGGLWVLVHTVYSGYKAFKKDVYDKLNVVVTKTDCKDNRDRIEADIREVRGKR
jgi:hypothetical protein